MTLPDEKLRAIHRLHEVIGDLFSKRWPSAKEGRALLRGATKHYPGPSEIASAIFEREKLRAELAERRSEDELWEANAPRLREEIEKLRALVEKAWRDGRAYGINSHETFVQTYPDWEQWKKENLT